MSSWTDFLGSLPPVVNQQLHVAEKPQLPQDEELLSLLNSLPPDVRESLLPDTDAAITPSSEACRWLLCVCPEGQFPRLHAFSHISGLLSAVAKLEGTETAIWAVHGSPLKLTQPVAKKSGREVRYLLLPNQLAAEVRDEAEGLRIVQQASLPADVKIQEEGWLGSTALLRTGEYFVSGYAATDDDSDLTEDEDSEDETEGIA